MNDSSPAPVLTLTQKLDALFKPWDRNDAPGLAVGIAHKGEVIYRRGFGLASIEHAVANSPTMRMRIASTSKHFTCFGVMLLVEDGKLDVNQPVGAYLPELGDVAGRPTLLQLMHHTGGLYDMAVLGFFESGGQFTHMPEGATLQTLPRLKGCNFEPGTRFAYSNTGYTLLSLVIERISGKSWAAFMGERVFAPLGMRDTTLLTSDMKIVPNLATQHMPAPDGSWRRGIYPTDDLLGSGGMISTVDDMLAWTAHLRGAQKKVGSAETWKKMFERQVFPSGASHPYALGLMVDQHRGVRTISHSGAVLGATHQMLTAPEHELDVVVMSNRMDGPAVALALKVLETVVGSEGLTPEIIPATAAEHRSVQGRWYSRASDTLIGITPLKPRADWPELLVLSTYNEMLSVLRKVGAGLAMPEAGNSTLEIRTLPAGDAPPAHLDVHVCGELERFERLPDAPPSAESLAPALCGRYRMPGSTKEFEIALRAGKLVFDLLPTFGSGYWELQPYAEDVIGCGAYHSVPRFPLPNAAVLAVERQGGKVTGLRFSTDRMRHLRFERI